MTREIENIAKVEHMHVLVKAYAETTHAEFLKRIEDRKANPFDMLEWGDTLFELAAKHRFYAKLTYLFETVIQRREEGDTKIQVEWTLEQVRKFVSNEFRHIAAVSRSSNQSHNLVNAYLCDIVRSFLNDDWSAAKWFHEAQRRDTEFQSWQTIKNEEYHQQRVAADLEAARIRAAKETAVRDARRKVKRSVKAGVTPSDLDLLTAYPGGSRIFEIDDLVTAAKRRAMAERGAIGI